jgi:hypothetical protein
MPRVYKLMAAVGTIALLWAILAARRADEGEAFVHRIGTPPGPVRILRFYATSGLLLNGQKAQLCYGVENAKSVRIAPLAGEILPSARRCLEIGPSHTTHYTILAEGYDGKMATQSLTLAVRGPVEVPMPKVNYAGI